MRDTSLVNASNEPAKRRTLSVDRKDGDNCLEGRVILVKVERGLADAKMLNHSTNCSSVRDSRMSASCNGKISNGNDDGEGHDDQKQQELPPQLRPPQRHRRQVLASLGQPPRASRLVTSRRGVSLDRSESRQNSLSASTSDDELEPVFSTSINSKLPLTAESTGSQHRGDHSRRDFIEKLRHFERLTGKGEPSSNTPASVSGDKVPLANNNSNSTCQSVPLARRPPPPLPTAPPKPPYQPHPDIENRLRFFDAAFGRHSNLRDRQLENLVTPQPTAPSSSDMSTSVSSANVMHQHHLLPSVSSPSSADDTAIGYSSHQKNLPDLMSYSMTSAPSFSSNSAAGPAKSGRIDVLNRISNQLLLSTTTNGVSGNDRLAPSPQSLTSVTVKPGSSAINKSLQATEAELRRELEHLDLMLSNIKDNNNNGSSNGDGNTSNNDVSGVCELSPLASIARERRHSVATGAMTAANGNRIARIQTVTLAPQISKSSVMSSLINQQEVSTAKSFATSPHLAPACLRAEIQNYRRSNVPTTVEVGSSSVVSSQSKVVDEINEKTGTASDISFIDNAQLSNAFTSNDISEVPDSKSTVASIDRLSPQLVTSEHSNSPSPPTINGGKSRRVVVVRAKVPVSTVSGQSNSPVFAGSDSFRSNAQSSPTATIPNAADLGSVHKINQDHFAVSGGMLSPSSSASSAAGISELSDEIGHKSSGGNGDNLHVLPPPPTPSPPSRDNCSSDSSTPPPPPRPLNDHQESEDIEITFMKSNSNEAVASTTLVGSKCFVGRCNGGNIVTSTGSASNGRHSLTSNGHFTGQPSPSLTPTTSNSDNSGVLSSVSNSALATLQTHLTPSNASTNVSMVSSPIISSQKQQQQILRDISTLRHCLIDIETQQQHILQEVSALRAEATAFGEVESIREAIRAAELRFELERERANARLVAARTKVHLAARELQHLEQQRLLTTPVNGGETSNDEGDEEALAETRQNLATLQEDVADADFELVEAETRYESERERLISRLSAANEAATNASLLAKNNATAGLIGGNSSYDFWIRRLTEHYRQLDGKRQLIERNIAKLQMQLPFNTVSVLSSGSALKESNSVDCNTSLDRASSGFEKELACTDTDQDKRSTGKTEYETNCSSSSNNNGADTNSYSDGVPADSSSVTSRPISVGDDQQSAGTTANLTGVSTQEIGSDGDGCSTSVKLRHHVPTIKSRMMPSNERPRTLFLPQPDNTTLDLREHLDALSHDWRSCSHVALSSDGSACRGWLHKLSRRLQPIVRPWSRRWFLFDRQQRNLLYFSDTAESNPRDQIAFSSILDVYVETASSSSAHTSSSSGHRTHRPPNSCSNLLIVVQTIDRRLVLAAPSPQAARIWVDVLCTGAAGNQSYEASTPPDELKPLTFEGSAQTLRS